MCSSVNTPLLNPYNFVEVVLVCLNSASVIVVGYLNHFHFLVAIPLLVG